MRFTLLSIRAFVVSLLFATVCRAEVETYQHKVLLLNSYHQNLPWTADLTRGVEETFAADRSHPVDLMVENMDTKRITSPAYLATFVDLLRLKYGAHPPDVVIVADNNALTFLIDHRAELFPGTPVVFCGINDFNTAMLKGETGVTGAPEVPKIRSTAELALFLQPSMKKLVVIHDFLKTGIAWKKEAAHQLAGFPVKIEYAPQIPRAKLLTYLSHLEPQTAVLLTVYFADGEGVYYPADESLSLMTKASSAPIYGSLDFQLADGIVGGDLIGGYLQGKQAALMANAILRGASPDTIPVASEGTSSMIFDWTALRRYDIDADRLPATARVINRPEHGLSVSPVIAASVIALILLEGAIVTLLVVNVNRRRKAERGLRFARNEMERKVIERTRALEETGEALRREVIERRSAMESLGESEERYRQMFHFNSAVKLLIDPQTGDILEANEAAALFYGYRRDNLLTMKITDINVLSPDEVRREMALAKSRRQIHFNLRHRVASGEIKDVEVYSGPLKIRDQTVLFSIIIDATERRRAEAALAANERNYRSLFENVSIGLVRLDPQEVIIRANPAAALLFGCTPEGMTGRSWRDFLSPDEEKPSLADIDFAGGNRAGSVHLQRRGVTRDGHEIGLTLSVTEERTADGNATDYVLIVEKERPFGASTPTA